MKRRPLQWNVFRDDGGQAMTEFVIVIPIILLLFFAMLQYFAVVQASQLANYAAFESARVYAVRYSVDPNDAQSKAKMAACMVMGPVASPMPGEIPVLGSYLSMANSTLSQYIPGLTKYFEGLAFAYFFRFGVLGGSVSNSINGNQVDCTINYPQPIFVPGLSAMWNFLSKDKTKNISTDTVALESGLGGLVKAQETVNQAQSQASSAASEFNSLFGTSISLPSIPQILLPYVNIQAKCSLGASGWSGSPRLPDDTDDTSGVDTNLNNAQDTVKNFNQANQNYTNAVAAAANDCQTMTTACGKIAADNNTINSYNATPPQNRTQTDTNNFNAATSDKPTQQGIYSGAQTQYGTDNGNVNTYAGQVNQYQSQLNNVQNNSPNQTGSSTAPSSYNGVPSSVDCKTCNGN